MTSSADYHDIYMAFTLSRPGEGRGGDFSPYADFEPDYII